MHNCLSSAGKLLLLFNLILFISCSKEEGNTVGPLMTLHTPTENGQYLAGDTIRFSATISDPTNITFVNITLKNSLNVPVSPTANIQVNQASYTLQYDFVLSDSDLNGRYYFDITAMNESAQTTTFRNLWITALPLELMKALIFTGGSNQTNIYELEGQTLSLFNTLQGDFLSSGFDQKNFQLYSVGAFSGDLIALDTGGNVVWQFEAPNIPSVKFFRGLHVGYDGPVVSTHDARLISFLPDGQKKMDLLLTNQENLGSVYYRNSELFYVSKNVNTNRESFNILYYPSGSDKGSGLLEPGEHLIHIHDFSPSEVYMLINSGSNSIIKKFSINDLFFNLSLITQGEVFNSALSVDNNTIVFSRGNGLYKYLIDKNLTFPLASNFSPSVIRYDRSRGAVWAAEGNQLKIIGLDGKTLNSLTLSENISSIELVFNR